ncbi:hypothetical protein D1007_52503 [Hordeum vulgare]|nr:hypothetical protein D1007_52503 [Hordeum vulgare]
MAFSVADQEEHKDFDEKDVHREHESPALLRQDSDLADVGSECSNGINSVDVELENSDIDEREIVLHHFVFERSEEREAYLASTKGKDHDENYMPKSGGSSTMPLHPVGDLQRRLLVAQEDERVMAEWRQRHPEDVAYEQEYWTRHREEDTRRRREERLDRRRRKALACAQADLVNAGRRSFFTEEDERWFDIWLSTSDDINDDDDGADDWSDWN